MAVPLLSSTIVFPFSTKSQLPLNQTLFSISPSSDSHCSWKWRTQLLLHQPSLPISTRTRNVLSAISDDDSEVSTQFGETENETELAKKWREIHGSGDWADLLDPMNPILRSELIRYDMDGMTQ
ncbi:phospholipase A1-Igamma2 [Cucumis melo var. makuwa]|uniref:Phospholipase A1-Igamma2 n=1 Tax=Cucumis melo var. makuwa TaxID=1194695 RepID=A0A5A7V1U8_CUCMM|nr:phospholipase A1-Igamma2 [Cucumis melo var. makuwa]TYK26138.1 phospholipase A1-Igamma2 [Cucumis melo var. makuwa]